MAQVLKMRFLVRCRSAAEWTAKNEILLASTSGTGAREMGIEEDTGRFKLGDGLTPWNDLPYTSSSSTPVPGTGIDIDDTDPQHPVINCSLAAVALSGRVDAYANLPSLGPSDAGKAYLVEADGMVYVWSGTAWPSSGGGAITNRDVQRAFYRSSVQESLSKQLSWQPTHNLVPSDLALTTAFSYTFTPKLANSRIRAVLHIPYTGCPVTTSLRTALLAGSNVVAACNSTGAGTYAPIVLVADFASGSTDPITFRIGFATSSPTTIYVNGGSDGSVFFNGGAGNTLQIDEYIP